MENQMLHESPGQRLKRLAKEYGYKRDLMAMKLHCTPGHVTRFYNDTTVLSDDRAKLLAKEWGLRAEYILGIDDFKTDDDIYQYANAGAVDDMKIALNYLESLGLILKPCTAISIMVTAIYKNLPAAERYIKQTDLQLLKQEFNFDLPSPEFHKAYFLKRCAVELSSPIPNYSFLDIDNFSDKTKIESDTFGLSSSSISVSDENNPFHINFEIYLFFKAYYQEKLIRTFTIYDVQQFVATLKAYSVFSIENIFLKELSYQINPPHDVFSTIGLQDNQ